MRRIIFIGLLAGITMLIISLAWSAASNALWPQLIHEYQNPVIFRSWDDPVMSLFFLHPIIVGVILSWIWSKANHLIKIESRWKRGAAFGLIYWLTTISGMIISYSTFQVSLAIVFSWTVNGLIQAVVAGVFFSYYDLLKKNKTNSL